MRTEALRKVVTALDRLGVETVYQEIKWSKAEKQVAREAFDAAYERECRAIRAKVVQVLERQDDIRQIWRVHDYLSEERRATDRKYDYRYSQLDMVFGILLREGWLKETELGGLGQDKLQRIKAFASL